YRRDHDPRQEEAPEAQSGRGEEALGEALVAPPLESVTSGSRRKGSVLRVEVPTDAEPSRSARGGWYYAIGVILLWSEGFPRQAGRRTTLRGRGRRLLQDRPWGLRRLRDETRHPRLERRGVHDVAPALCRGVGPRWSHLGRRARSPPARGAIAGE